MARYPYHRRFFERYKLTLFFYLLIYYLLRIRGKGWSPWRHFSEKICSLQMFRSGFQLALSCSRADIARDWWYSSSFIDCRRLNHWYLLFLQSYIYTIGGRCTTQWAGVSFSYLRDSYSAIVRGIRIAYTFYRSLRTQVGLLLSNVPAKFHYYN